MVERTLDGFYATVHIVRLRGGDLRVVKSFHRRGIAEGEAVAIERLARVTGSRTAVPEVLDVRVDGECDVIVQSYLPGEPASDVAAENGGLGGEGRAALAGEVCDIVEHWHSTRGSVFEDRQGGRHSSFTASYTADIEVLAAWLESADDIDADLRRRILGTVPLVPDLLEPLEGDPPVFIHDDCHAGNFLADPSTGRLLGVIDPGQARFSHRELDLFHLSDAAPQLELRELALARQGLAPGAELRRLFFSLWDDVKHAQASGWRDDRWMTGKVTAFARRERLRGSRTAEPSWVRCHTEL